MERHRSDSCSLRKVLAAFGLAVVAGLFACTPLARVRCEQLKASGQLYATMDSCVTCMNHFGSDNLPAVSGCALGLDAGTLMAPQSGPAVPNSNK